MNDARSADNPHAEKQAPAEFAQDAAADLTPTLKHLLAGNTLSAEQTTEAFEAMMTGRVHHGEMGALLALLATRTPTADEILGAARVMRAHVDEVSANADPDQMVDTAGAGGAPKTFNVSTASAIIAAAGGVIVPKHGNRSRTGRGSAEVLAALGVNVDADRAVQQKCLDEIGVCFCFAVHHHPATKHVMPVRLTLGFPTIFNLLGPLTNPAGARRQVMGVYHERFLRPIAEALRELGALHAMVLHSEDGLDELSISAATKVLRVKDGAIAEERVEPENLGLSLAPKETVTANDLNHASAMVKGVIDGTEQGPPRDMTLLATAATLLVADRVADMREGVERSRELIDSGAAKNTLESLVRLSNA